MSTKAALDKPRKGFVWQTLDLVERFLASNLVQWVCFCVFMSRVVFALGLGIDEYIIGMIAFGGLVYKIERIYASIAKPRPTS